MKQHLDCIFLLLFLGNRYFENMVEKYHEEIFRQITENTLEIDGVELYWYL